MNKTVGCMLVFVLMFVAAPAFSAEATQIWKCEMDDAVTEKQVRDMAGEWLKAAKGMEGGQNLKASVLFPVAVNMVGTTDVMFVIVAPTFEEWGKFWDGYEGSPAAAIDKRNEEMGVVCPDSAVWESIEVK